MLNNDFFKFGEILINEDNLLIIFIFSVNDD